MAACGWFVLICFFFPFLSIFLSTITTVLSSTTERPPSPNINGALQPEPNCLYQQIFLLSNPSNWTRNVSVTSCVPNTTKIYSSESIRVSPNEVEMINRFMCSIDKCDRKDENWYTKYCPQSFKVKVSWYLQRSNLSDLTCACNTRTCEDNTCISRKPNGCSYKRTGLIITGRSCADTSYILYSEDSSNHDMEYERYTLLCNFSDYCNEFSASEIKEFVCPALLMNELRLPDPENFPVSDKTDKRQCASDEWNGPTCSLSSTDGFCFKYIIKFLRRSSLKTYTSEGCDENIEKNTVFDMQRTIYLFTTGRVVVKWECGKPNCMTDYNQAQLFPCFNDIDRSFDPTVNWRRGGQCRCTPEGMGPDLAKFCINGVCSRDSIVQEREIYSNHSFFCSNFGQDRYGCYFKNSQPFGVLYIDVLTYNGNEKTRRMLCTLSKCNKQRSITTSFGCNDTDDQLFGPIDNPDKPATKLPHIVSVNPAEVLGPVGAIVVIFLTVVIGIIVIINTVVVYKVQKKWRYDDKLKEKRAQARGKNVEEKNKTDSNMTEKKMSPKSSPKKTSMINKSPKSPLPKSRERSRIEMKKSSKEDPKCDSKLFL